MSGPVAEGKFVFTEEGLDQVEQRLNQVRDKANGLLARLPKELQKQLRQTGEALADEMKAMVPAALNSMQGAILGPAKSTFGQVIEEANRARRDASQIAVSTGKSLEDVNARINMTAKATKEMPQTVVAWARSVRDLTGDFEGAVSMMAAAKDRALQLDKPISALSDQAARLSMSFGVQNKQQLDSFFGSMDAQATRAGVSVQRLDRQFMTFLDSFGRLSSKGGGAFSGLSAAFAASSANPEQAIRNQGFGMGLLNMGVRQIEQRMRLGGVLGKGESITDMQTGEVDPKKYLAAMKFLQKDLVKYYGSKRRAIEIQAGDDLEARRDVAGFLSADLSKVDDLSKLPPEQRKALDRYSGMDAGKREGYDVDKALKDQEAGKPLLKAQDKAVQMGGGAAGLAMNQAAGLFSTAVDKFGGIVTGLAGGALAGMGRTALSGAGAALTAGGAAARGGAALLGTAAGGAAMLVGTGVAAYQAGSYADQELGLSDKISNQLAKWFVPGYEEGTPSSTTGGPQEITLSSGTHRTAAEANAAALATRTLRVQIVPTVEAPQSQPPPK